MGWFDKKPNAKDEPGSPHSAEAPRVEQRPMPASPLPSPQEPAAMTASPQAPPPPAEPESRGLASLFGARPSEPAGLGSVASIAASEGGSVFAESVEIEGSLEGEGDVVLRGQVRGSISITGTLMVAETGRVHADVSAREVVCGGTVEGNIHATEKVRVQSTGLVQGDIDSPSIVIDDGGGVEGFVQMEPPGGEETDEDAAPPRLPAAGRIGRTVPRSAPDPGAPAMAEAEPHHRLTREMLLGLEVPAAAPAAGLLNRPLRAPATLPSPAPATRAPGDGDGFAPIEDGPLSDVLGASAGSQDPLHAAEPLADATERPIPDF